MESGYIHVDAPVPVSWPAAYKRVEFSPGGSQQCYNDWHPVNIYIKFTPAQLQRRLAAIGDTVYCTPGLSAPVTTLDAATGKVLQAYKGTERTQEFVFDGGVLYLVIGDRQSKTPLTGRHRRFARGCSRRHPGHGRRSVLRSQRLSPGASRQRRSSAERLHAVRGGVFRSETCPEAQARNCRASGEEEEEASAADLLGACSPRPYCTNLTIVDQWADVPTAVWVCGNHKPPTCECASWQLAVTDIFSRQRHIPAKKWSNVHSITVPDAPVSRLTVGGGHRRIMRLP